MKEYISVVMSAYNEEERHIGLAIDSILNQSYENFEFIIVLDNPLNSKLRCLLEKYAEIDNRIKIIINRKNIGLAESLNKAIDLAQGDFIARMDADDISISTRLEQELNYLITHFIDVVSTNCVYIDESGKILGAKSSIPTDFNKIKVVLPYGSSIIHPSVMMKKNVIVDVGGYRNFRTAQDYDLWLRLITCGYSIGSIDKPLLHYRIRKDSISSENRFKQMLTSQYQRQLYKQRLSNGKDDFSLENYNIYLEKNGLYNGDNIKSFSKAYNYFEIAFSKMNQKKYFQSFLNLVIAGILNSVMRNNIINIVVYKFKILLNNNE